jgi:NAD(P)-dependent dehydrogenase (short-subunit alcohol dehydrogenase family)
MEDLSDKKAIVTGGGSGIGRKICQLFAQAGATLVIPDIDLEGAEQTAQLIAQYGQETLPLKTDVSNPEEVDKLFAKTLRFCGRVDILINNAGVSHPTQSILELDLAHVDKVFNVDYKGVYLCSRRAGQEMIKGSGGCILNISSIAGITPLPLTMYGPMKSAVNMLTRILAREWAKDHVRVNAIAPGYVLTPLIQEMIDKGLRNPDLIIEHTPMKKMLGTEDIAQSALFLCSDAARNITGAILPVDGGWLSDGGWVAYNR